MFKLYSLKMVYLVLNKSIRRKSYFTGLEIREIILVMQGGWESPSLGRPKGVSNQWAFVMCMK